MIQVSSVELENVITDIPGVMVAAVVGVSNYEDGEHPMAFVELEPGAEVSAQKIKDYVKGNVFLLIMRYKNVQLWVNFFDIFRKYVRQQTTEGRCGIFR